MFPKKIFTLLLISLVILVGMFGCQKNDATQPEKEKPPEIPPVSTFLMDFDAFPDTATTLLKSGGSLFGKTLTHQNWGWAALNVAVWNTLLTITFAVPVAAFAESFNHEPVQQDDGSWVWSYSVTVGNAQYTANLHATLVAEGVQWEMYISRQNGFSNFLWYSGLSEFSGQHGTWTLFHEPNDPTPFLGIEWNRSISEGTADIKYTNIIPNHPENGGYIFYGIVNQTPYDAFYDI